MVQGAPYQALSVPSAMWSGVGLTDIVLAPKGPYSAMASAQDGHVSQTVSHLLQVGNSQHKAYRVLCIRLSSPISASDGIEGTLWSVSRSSMCSNADSANHVDWHSSFYSWCVIHVSYNVFRYDLSSRFLQHVSYNQAKCHLAVSTAS